MSSTVPTTPVPATPNLTVRSLLFPTDFTDQAGAALEQALFIARRHGASLQLLHVAETPQHVLDLVTPEREATIEHIMGEGEAKMELLLSEHDLADVDVTSTVIQAEKAAPAILDYARTHDFSLIVMPTHERHGGLKRLFMGSTAEEVIREAPCPVFIVRERHPGASPRELRRILKPIDFSDDCRSAIPLAKELAQAYEADLQVLHVVEDDPPPVAYELDTKPVRLTAKDVEQQVKRHMQEMVDQAEGPHVHSSFHVTTGHAAGTIVDFSEQNASDLIVLAAHGRSGLRRFLLGSTAERVARGAACPVLVVHTKQQEDPASID